MVAIIALILTQDQRYFYVPGVKGFRGVFV